MRKAWYIASKELLQTRRDRLAALFTIVLPVIFTVFLGLLFGGFGASDLPLAIADSDGTSAAADLLEQLEAEPALRLQPMALEALESAVQNQEVAAGLIIPQGYGAAWEEEEPLALSFVRLDTSSGAQSAYQAVLAVVGRLQAERAATRVAAREVAGEIGADVDDRLLASSRARVNALLAQPVAEAVVTDSTRAARGLGGFEQASTGSLVNWTLFGLLTVATGVAWERRRGLLLRLSTMRVGGAQIIGGKMLAMVILTFFQQLFLVLLGQLAFGVDYFSSPAALFMVMLSLSLLAASVGLLIASLFRSEQAVVATTVITAQLLAALSGAWFPLEITSATFSQFAHFLPTAWIMDSLHGIVLRDWGVLDVLQPLGFVWIWIVVFFGLAVWRFRPH